MGQWLHCRTENLSLLALSAFLSLISVDRELIQFFWKISWMKEKPGGRKLESQNGYKCSPNSLHLLKWDQRGLWK